MACDHYAIIFDEENKPMLHVAKWDPDIEDYIHIDEYIQDIADSLSKQFLEKYIK